MKRIQDAIALVNNVQEEIMHGETILCIATRVWHSLWRSTQQTMSRFAVQNRVLYFEPGRNPDLPMASELRRNFSNFFALRTQRVQENLIVIPTPSCLPVARRHLPRPALQITTPLVAKINAQILIRHIRWAMHTLDVQAPILWLYSPSHIDLIGEFGEKLVCYFNYDEYANFVQNARIKDLIRRLDDELTRRADVVFATSRAQSKQRVAINPSTYLIPNGVNFDLFNRALDPDLPLPADIANLPRPIIGYTGWLGEQIDVGLLTQVADAYPNFSFALIGPDELPETGPKKELRTRPNVSFLGRKAPHELPMYLKAFDVALIPYLLVGYTLTAYPLKLHEYLAAGRAIVATALPELRPYSEVVRIAETWAEFVCQIREALQDHGPQAIEARVAIARENTWDNRVADIYRILEPLLPGREKPRL
jgi:glycosyltransferase involved in cell wall biosynthesis